jgi:hypothetical protein
VARLEVPPPTPIIRAAVDTRPSLAPSTSARSQGARLLWCLHPRGCGRRGVAEGSVLRGLLAGPRRLPAASPGHLASLGFE